MFLASKYLEGDAVTIIVDGYTLNGTIYKVDKGIFTDPHSVYYDVLSHIPGDINTECLYKHVLENSIYELGNYNQDK